MIPESGIRFPDKIMPERRACPVAIRRLGDNGLNARTIERMDAIQDLKTMAGSQGAEIANVARSAPRNLAHGFCGLASVLS
jgi:hypothetical protein